MIKIIKGILITLVIVIIIWVSFVTIDCIRLGKANYYTTPLIKLKEVINKDETTYVGLGYEIKYIHEKVITHEEGSDFWLTQTGAVGAEFRLFGKILIWAYIE